MSLPPLSLYVHIPWCERKCPYCDFNSHVSDSIPETAYVDALCQEIVDARDVSHQRPLSSIFFGGGTPSLFSATAIGRIIDAAERYLGLANGCEITLEANPGSSEQTRFSEYRSTGINRLSLGVQSFHDEHLQRLGRVHSANSAHSAIQAAIDAGFTRLNIDLMYALGEQSPDQAQQDLLTALAYEADHISWYQLTIEQNTEYFKKPPKIPNDIATELIEQSGRALLAEHGFGRYEVSAYAKAGGHSAHNLNYWEFGDYIGIGAGAHGKLTSKAGLISRYANTRLPKDYLSRDHNKRASEITLDPEDLVAEFMMNALRLKEGVPRKVFNHTGLNESVLEATISRLNNQKLMLPLNSGRICCTPKGYSLLNSVIEQFI